MLMLVSGCFAAATRIWSVIFRHTCDGVLMCFERAVAGALGSLTVGGLEVDAVVELDEFRFKLLDRPLRVVRVQQDPDALRVETGHQIGRV